MEKSTGEARILIMEESHVQWMEEGRVEGWPGGSGWAETGIPAVERGLASAEVGVEEKVGEGLKGKVCPYMNTCA